MLGIRCILLVFFERIQPMTLYLLPLPPIGVAAYVFAFSLLKKYGESSPPTLHQLVLETCLATLVSGGAFLLFVSAILALVSLFR